MISRDDLARDATPARIAEYVGRSTAEIGDPGHEHEPGHGGHGVESVREATYKGHHIVVRTTYHIEIDGKPIEGHLAVTNDGRVHYHTLPNVSYGSAIDLLEQLIDAFPDDFGRVGEPTDPPHDHH